MKRLKPAVLVVLLIVGFSVSFHVHPVLAAAFFEDGFEGGDWGPAEWTSNSTTGSSTIDADHTTTVHHGSESLECYCASGSREAWVYKDFASSYSEIYTRAYVRFTAVTDSERNNIMAHRTQSPDTWLTIGGVKYVGGSPASRWNMRYRDGASESEYTNDTGPSLNVWYCMEVYTKIHNAQGISQMWIDGALTCEATGLDTNNYGDIDRLRIGENYGDYDQAYYVYVDCVVADTSYIGPEAAGAEYTETFSESVSFSESGSFWGAYSRMTSETVTATATFAYLGRSTACFFTETVTVEEAADFWREKLHLFSEVVNLVSQSFFSKELSVTEVEEVFTETVQQDGSLSVWREKRVTVYESTSPISQLGKWIALTFTGEETAAPSSGFDRWRSLWFLHTPTVTVQDVLSALSERLVTAYEFLESVNVVDSPDTIMDFIVAPITIEDVAGLAALAFILALLGIALVFTYTSKRG